MSKIEASIKKIKEVLIDTLTIPDYQRPYRWTENNVRQLLEDISNNWQCGKKLYRVGSVILHKESENNIEKFNIVDGQQRITTILLLLKVLESNLGSTLLKRLQYKHSDSVANIKNNYDFIVGWVDANIKANKQVFTTYLTDYCEFVEIIVTDLSEAFQMFDSQNGRGKELEAYNLLKAYHIRAMEFDNYETKIECDKRWEDATRFKKDLINDKNHQDLLRQIFNEQLYRTRIWSKKEDAYSFSKKRIDEFKGFTINQNKMYDYPFLNSQLLQFIAKKYIDSNGLNLKNVKKRFNNLDIQNIDPFVLINQKIINGKDFFDYIETYIEIYKQLFIYENEPLKDFKIFYNEYCVNYSGADRSGDIYLRELYKSLIFLMFDKFGEEGVKKYHETLYKLVYRKRLESMQVKYDVVAQYPKKYLQMFSIIEQANSYLDLQKLEKQAKEKFEIRYTNASKVQEFFTKIKEA